MARAIRLVVLTMSAAALVLAYGPAGHAAGPFTPTTTADGGLGSGSLRDAILQANAAGGVTEINLDPSQIYQLTMPDLTGIDEDGAQIVGESLFGVLNAGLIVAFSSDAPIAILPSEPSLGPILGALAFSGLVIWLYGWMLRRTARRSGGH